MKKYLFIVLSVSFGWGQVEEGISYYESGLKKHQRPYENKVQMENGFIGMTMDRSGLKGIIRMGCK